MTAKTQALVKTETKPLNVDRSGLLQRKCDCGKSAGLTGQCSECQSKQFTKQPGSIVQTVSAPVLHELIQPKLRVSEPGDRYEQEADRIADQVMRMPDRPSGNHGLSFSSVDASTAQRKCTAGEEEEKLQRKDSGSTAEIPTTVPPGVHEVLRSPAANPVQGEVLQRKCACKNGAGAAGTCAECQGKQALSLQTKLRISEPGDRYEQEADRIADQVMRMPKPAIQRQMDLEEDEEEGMVQKQIANPITPLVQRQVLPEMNEEEEEVIQTKARGNQTAAPALTQASSEVPSSVHEALSSPGQPLDPTTRVFMEQRFGHDFSNVRVHSGSAAEQSAQEVNAHAYTVGSNIVFDSGRFAPGTHEGRRLLAHELTHVLQQSLAGGERQTHCLQRDEKERKSPVKDKEAVKNEKPKAELRPFDTQEAAQTEATRLTGLGIGEVEIGKRNKRWIITFRRLSKPEAEKEAAAKQPTLASGLEAGTAYDDVSASHYVKIYLKCPEGVPAKPGFHVWHQCFVRGKAQEAAEKQRQKLSAGYGQAELYSRPDATGFAIYYKALTNKVLDEQKTSAEKQLESDKTQKPLDKCPSGYTNKGIYKLTTYFLPLEKDSNIAPTTVDPCGLKGTFRNHFLAAVKLQGSGVSLAGEFIQYDTKKSTNKKNCYYIGKCAETADQTCATIGRTVAVDKKDIPLGSTLLIEGVGERIAEDTGGGIKGKEIDVYRGLLSEAEAWKLTLPDKRVCIKKKSK